MKLQIVSDLHLEFDQSYQERGYDFFTLARSDADVIVLAGDVWYGLRGIDWAGELARSHDKPVVMVFGNHDYWAEARKQRYRIDTLLRKARERSEALRERGVPLWFLENGEAVIEGVRFLGATLWTDYNRGDTQVMWLSKERMNDFASMAGRVHPVDLYKRHLATREWLQRRLCQPHEGSTVVVTHHVPTPVPLTPRYGDLFHRFTDDYAYGSDLTELIADNEISLWVHGHRHQCRDEYIEGTRLVANPRGYMPYDVTPGFAPGRLFEVEVAK